MKRFWELTKKGLRAIYGGPWYKKAIVWFCTLILTFILALIAVDINFLWLFGYSPGFAEIKDPETSEASEIYSADSVLIGRYYNEDRTPVTYEEISPLLIRTLIDTEDERFYHHHGIDFEGVIAAFKDMTQGHARGASTITQQLAKNLFRVRTHYSTGLLGEAPGLRMLIIKAKEWIVAVKLEAIYSKEDILTMYLNTVDFGSNAYGIKTAAKVYFDTTPDKLTYEQAATLVGLLKATSTYNPRINPKNSLERRNVVLNNLYAHEDLIINGNQATPAQFDSILNTPLQVAEKRSERKLEGQAPYFRDALVGYIEQLCETGFVEGYDMENKLDVFADGLKIYTTLDTRMQALAEEACLTQMEEIQEKFNSHWGNTSPWRNLQGEEIPNFIENIAEKTDEYRYLNILYNGNKDSIEYHLNKPHTVKVFSYKGGTEEREMSTMDSIRYMVRFMHCSLVAMEPDTKEVKAWVGDIDYDFWKYDKVTAMRQPGSTFKLFVYAAAMNMGLTPCDTRKDEFVSYPDTTPEGNPTTWTPHNADGRCSGRQIPLKSAFAQSINTIAVKLGYECGIRNVAQVAYDMGIESHLEEKPSLSLGSSDVHLLELVNGYSTAVDDGQYEMPILITKIVDRKGKVIYEASPQKMQAIPHRSAVLLQMLLRAGCTEAGGTSQSLNRYLRGLGKNLEYGGKTGTSNNHVDGWFIGVTPHLVGGVWVGNEHRSIHFRTGALGQGNRTALPIFGTFMQSVMKDERLRKRYDKSFPKAKDVDPSCWNCYGVYTPHHDDGENEDNEEQMETNDGGSAGTDTPRTAVSTDEAQ